MKTQTTNTLDGGEKSEKPKAVPIEKLNISFHTRMALKAAKILTVQDVLEVENGKGILHVCNLKKTHHREVMRALESAEDSAALKNEKAPVLQKPHDIPAEENQVLEEKEQPTESKTLSSPLLSAEHKVQPSTVVFVDYEHWYMSLRELHQRRPNIDAWFSDLKTRGKLLEVNFFGDFSGNGGMKNELANIRRYSNRIIETKNPSEHYKKDFTDFIMLDCIYQKIITAPEVEQIVLFTGDGHFSSVASYLKNFCSKVVGVYGIDLAINKQLERISDWCIRIPFADEPYMECREAILRNMKYAEAHTQSPMFGRTVDAVAQQCNLPDDAVEAELRLMLSEGVIYTVSERSRWDHKVMLNILKVNWNLVEQ